MRNWLALAVLALCSFALGCEEEPPEPTPEQQQQIQSGHEAYQQHTEQKQKEAPGR